MRILVMFLWAMALVAADLPRRAPGFALTDIQGKWYDLYDFRGKPVVLEFMQTNCPHCAGFVAVLEKVQQKYGDRVKIISIANPPDNPNTMSQFVAGHQLTYPLLFDMGQVAYSYILKPRFDLPAVFVIDANGMIHNSFEYGPMTRDIFEGNGLLNELDKMLGAPTAAPKRTPGKK